MEIFCEMGSNFIVQTPASSWPVWLEFDVITPGRSFPSVDGVAGLPLFDEHPVMINTITAIIVSIIANLFMIIPSKVVM